MTRGQGSALARQTSAPQLPHSHFRESETQKDKVPSQQSDWGVTVKSVCLLRHVSTQTVQIGRGALPAAPRGATKAPGSQGLTGT